MQLTHRAGVALLLLMLAACGGPSGTSRNDDLFGEYGGGDTGTATTGTGADEGIGEGSPFDTDSDTVQAGPAASAESRLLYFDFDSSEIRDEYRELLAAHARYLAANPSARLRLEGHADERGSREYNIGLGERRAQAVRNVLLLQGASAEQLSTVSYGEERPAVLGSDEEAWSLNRRVELVYQR